jgi:ATP-dependent helicase/nuclease subunit B
VFELDRREEGSFQHEILARFHARVSEQKKRWRDISPAQGRELIAQIGADLKTEFQEGLADATASNRFRAEAKLAALQDFIEAYLELLRDCEFDPLHVELGFGVKNARLPGWQLQIDETRAVEFTGRIDRIDVWVDVEGKRCYALVYDYKSSERKLDRALVEHAIQQQLPAYLAALQRIGGLEMFPFEVRAAGGFYVNLRAKMKSAKSRAEAFDAEANDSERDLKQAGVFDWGLIDRLDSRRTARLFDYNVKTAPKKSVALKALEPAEFAELLSTTEQRLRDLGRRIFAGEVSMDPYRHRNQDACGTCMYGGICRIDPWTHEFRSLK